MGKSAKALASVLKVKIGRVKVLGIILNDVDLEFGPAMVVLIAWIGSQLRG
ncbi:MAG TPA: hypothetical protein VFF65_09125 [Phycisphaerales bacterium]|nr:hypothetical protein [Phycisphaerales bacterium]